jgi:hypothetical protein
MTDDFCGNMEGGIAFTSPKPFVLLGWPGETDAKTFDTEDDARQFTARVKIQDPFVTFARLYGFSGGKWNRL